MIIEEAQEEEGSDNVQRNYGTVKSKDLQIGLLVCT